MDLDEFSDDALDDLPDNALQALENNAVPFTQAKPAARIPPPQPQPQHQRQYSDYGGWDEDDDLDTSEVINDADAPVRRPLVDHSLPMQQRQPQRLQSSPPKQQQHQHQQQHRTAPRPPPPTNPHWNPTVDPSNRPNPSLAAARQRFPSQQTSNLGRPQSSQFSKPPLPTQRFGSSQQHLQHPENVLSALQQRVRALEAELNASRGEVSIIRANTAKLEQQHSAEVSRLKRLNAEQIARQERAVEAAIAAEKTASTELQFLQQDMREVNRRARRTDQAPAQAQRGAGALTPKKSNKHWVVADGFDEMEIANSPSKGHGRGKNPGPVAANVGERTPSKGKRKRPTVDSPVMALETHTDDVVMVDRPAPSASQPPPISVAAPSPPFEFLQLILDHAAFHEDPPTFDVLSRYTFPSEPNTSLATHIFHTLPMMGHPQRPMQLLVDFSERIIGLWTRSYHEETWEPIKYLLELIIFTLQLHTTYVAPLIVNSLAVVAQATIRRLAEGRHRLPDGDLSKSDEYGFLELHIDTTKTLSLLQACALACVTSLVETDGGSTELKIVDFWRLMSLDFVTLLLTPKQKPSDIIGMLDMLSTSSLPGSIGPILDDKEPAFVARLIIERVSAKLTESPLSWGTTEEEKRSIRVASLRTMIAFLRYPFGALQLACHDNALPRIVTCLSNAIEDLYDQAIPPHILPQDPDAPPDTTSPSAVLYRTIGQCVLLIHTLVTDPRTSNAADIAQKLSVAYGGSQRYLISLGRLNFAEEDLVMEAGIDSEVVEMAHELLEMAVTPDEGEIVSAAFLSQG
ncbi:hypothetical protein ACRE_087920 [Hapsidospora chrysogenum ATCC 11550]|uniref:Uncharacterized protein n=1 Tax=Hapsidospora chrysogenum (strain ATCC 11550 / CBS 779.69 / DSM 880 / IAM 14645 / JCM 23072 / IMI 49137) TaxID=857340 RepID=A0A086STT7_HAPC1|nr:hypothetical protein ACRE_087920 [Hapsidospora chrysogenum ATCC 11550]